MAPFNPLQRLRHYYLGEEDQKLPVITTSAAVALLVLYTFLYIVPFYLSSTTRPSPQLSRDAPSVIRGRITTVTVTCIISSLLTFVLLASNEGGDPWSALHSMGYLPPGFAETAQCLGLTCLLFLGPLYEGGIAEGAWRDWLRLRGLWSLLGSWTGYRNFVAGPITEEVLFRSAAVPLFLISRADPKTIIFGTPIIFGLAHVHHFYEFRLTHPHTPFLAALMRSVFQFGYTTIFGIYATFLYLRTGSLLAVILVHAFCNWMGLPRFWGRVRATQHLVGQDNAERRLKKMDRDEKQADRSDTWQAELGVGWTIAYYFILVVGAIGFWRELWNLTESSSGLAQFP